MSLFELAGLTGLICAVLAFFFAKIKNFKMHKLFATIAFIAILLHAGIYFL